MAVFTATFTGTKVEKAAKNAVAVAAATVATKVSYGAVAVGSGAAVFATTTVNGQVVSYKQVAHYGAVASKAALALAA